MKHTVLSCATLAILLTGCASMAPEYSQPAAPVPAAWPEGPAYQGKTAGSSESAVTELPWQDFFADEKLRGLIELALANNRDLRVAALNIERARAQYRIQRADQFPKVDASGSFTSQRVPADFSRTGEATTNDEYTVGLGVSSYELDLFGRVQSLKDQALAQYLATEEASRAVRISLIAQVAAGYLNLAADRERLQLARETLAAQESSYQLMQHRFQAGSLSELELRQAQTPVEAARVDVARSISLVAQDENALNLVVGAPVPAGLQPDALSDVMTAVRDLRPGLPSEVLLQRPDILQAENLLKGYNANIGAARAAFFPRITLTGSAGFGSDELSGLFAAGSDFWLFAPRIELPIFDTGARSAKLKVAETDRDIALASYEKAIQSAFREVADALAQRGTIEEQLAAQQSLTDATAASYQLSQTRYEKGVDSYLTVLDAQRSLYGAQQGLIATRLTRLLNQVTLYKVLGGGAPVTETH
ncbi:MAG: AdeC/AdeK/OprM family multidrug efflux complex outer membrane factor [Desulfobulbaceae bacterium]